MLLSLLANYLDKKEQRDIRLSEKTRANAKKMANYENTQVKALLPKSPPSPMDASSTNDTPVVVLGKIFSMLKLMDEDQKLDREMVQTHFEEEEHKKNQRNKEIIQALTGRKTGKKGNRMKERAEKKKKVVDDKVIKKEEQKLKDMSPSISETTVGKAISTGTKVAAGAAILGTAGGIGGAIAKGESAKASYNASNMGTKNNKIIPSQKQEDIEHTTVGEIMRRQAIKWGDKNESEKLLAVGKYQMIPGTLSDAVKSMNIGKDAVLDGPLQERIFKEYLMGPKNPAIAQYLNSPVDDPKLLTNALRQISREWASIADPDIPGGRTSHYGNGNKASVTVEDAAMLLRHDREENMKLKALPADKTGKDVSKLSGDLANNRKELDAAALVTKTTNNTNVHSESGGTQTPEQKKVVDINPLLQKGKK